jgi:CBS domain-containing protein
MDRRIPAVRDCEGIRTTLEMMLKDERVWVPVVDEGGSLKGIVTMTQFACFFTQEAQGPGETD